MLLRVGLAVALTLALAVSTAIALLIVGGREGLMGARVIFESWYVLYPLEAVIVGGLMFALGRLLFDRLDRASLVSIVLAAWIGELVVLGSGLIANELVGLTAVPIWLLATGGPIQPIAAIVGGLLGRRSRLRT